MKTFFGITIFLLWFSSATTGQTKEECLVNSDKLYDRKRMIKQLGKALNKSVPENVWGKYGVTDNGNSPAGFFIFDLTDPSNKDITSTGCIEFKRDHIYHFAPFDFAFSLSHIAVLENGKVKIFKSINCQDRGDKLEEVIAYLNQKLANDKNKDEILERVKNYKKYGKYFKMDNYSTLVCQAVGEK